MFWIKDKQDLDSYNYNIYRLRRRFFGKVKSCKIGTARTKNSGSLFFKKISLTIWGLSVNFGSKMVKFVLKIVSARDVKENGIFILVQELDNYRKKIYQFLERVQKGVFLNIPNNHVLEVF